LTRRHANLFGQLAKAVSKAPVSTIVVGLALGDVELEQQVAADETEGGDAEDRQR
jgi:hypothetical protein